MKKTFEHLLGLSARDALALLKSGAEPTHPQVQEAARRCQQRAVADAKQMDEDIYSTGIAIIFLCELDPSKFATEIRTYLKSLELRQRGARGTSEQQAAQ